MNDREKKDAVTIGAIRRRFEAQLESDLQTLCGLIRKGYQSRQEAEKYLNGAIAETLTKLQNIDAMASTEILFPQKDLA